MADFTPPAEGILLAHFIVVADVERSTRFYTEVDHRPEGRLVGLAHCVSSPAPHATLTA
ncbi:MAG TPA: hypothetical protein VGO03_02635 [Acidimicrobiia bacterium]|jgi:hypothetical protein